MCQNRKQGKWDGNLASFSSSLDKEQILPKWKKNKSVKRQKIFIWVIKNPSREQPDLKLPGSPLTLLAQ